MRKSCDSLIQSLKNYGLPPMRGFQEKQSERLIHWRRR